MAGIRHLHQLLVGLFLVVGTSNALADERIRQRFEALQAGYAIEAAGQRLLATAALAGFYEQRDFTPAWLADAERWAFLSALEAVAADGLNPSDYHLDALQESLNRDASSLSAVERVDLDLLLSDSFLLLGSHLVEGKVNPETIDAEWFANRRRRDMAPVLARALENHAIIQTLDELRPHYSGYIKLREVRAHWFRHLDDEWPAISGGPAIKPGALDPRVETIRARLLTLGDLASSEVESDSSGDKPTNVYDIVLERAIKAFQSRHGLETDGIVGRETLAALNMTPEQRLQQIDLNLERWRWLPEVLGDTHVLVNIAGFELQLVEAGAVQLRKRVIVGRPFRRTPVFSDQIRYLVFNPTWTVPRKLMVEDKLPEIKRDPTYLQRLGFSVYEGWGVERRVVDPNAVDWSALSRSHFPYQLVQAPGPQNALGQVKFMFPNRFDVYLHDTPSRDLFDRSERSFSSGCIRVERPLELAERLLAADPAWSAARINTVTANAQMTTVYLKTPVPVHLGYWTAWSEAQGPVQFRKDIYSRDQRLLEALRMPVQRYLDASSVESNEYKRPVL